MKRLTFHAYPSPPLPHPFRMPAHLSASPFPAPPSLVLPVSQGPPSSASLSSVGGVRVQASAKSFTAGALPKAAFEQLTQAELVAAKAAASTNSKTASRSVTRDLEAV